MCIFTGKANDFRRHRAWVALEDQRDFNHTAALQFKRELLHDKTRLITTNYVLDETYTLLLLNVGYVKTVAFKQLMDEMTDLNLVAMFHVTPDIEMEAWNVFERYNRDKAWSFTDCTSKVLMERLGLVEVFTFDHHFDQMNLIRKPFLHRF